MYIHLLLYHSPSSSSTPFLRFHNLCLASSSYPHVTCVVCPHLLSNLFPPSQCPNSSQIVTKHAIPSTARLTGRSLAHRPACFLVCRGGAHPIPHQLPSIVSTKSSCRAGIRSRSATSSSTSVVRTQTGLSVHCLIPQTQTPSDTLRWPCSHTLCVRHSIAALFRGYRVTRLRFSGTALQRTTAIMGTACTSPSPARFYS
ncbi:hypothetical protein BDN67DRAFT_521491 [Paxillus ammoniavirescens]|nr:hypothetical protein BDN67DRAFT_521491 [Paxillus ammoniavirescens]